MAVTEAIRVVVRGDVNGADFRNAIVERSRQLTLMGWVRNDEDGVLRIHAEGE
ncbi:MAG: acylphosphatase, partial [Solirubrobacterales bacterium]|nr:acylphosphatase [Solirubrobacterales bacterium]